MPLPAASRLTAGRNPLIGTMLVAFLFAALSQGATLRRAFTFKGAYTGSQCAEPTADSAFTVADGQVHLYILVDNLQPTDVLTSRWVHQGSGRQNHEQTFTSVSSTGSWCFPGTWMSVSNLDSSWAGTWSADILVNGSRIGGATFRLSISLGGLIPNYSGFFDPIATDCSHFSGWALDTNSPSTSISVDIEVSGFPRITIPANQARGDLTGTLANHAWNKYDLQPYEDGQTHTVRVYYPGTTTEMPGSGRQFPPAGALAGCYPTLNAAPHINDITPRTVQVGVERTFTLTGTDFKPNFTGTLWVNNSPFAVSPTKTVYNSSTQVQLIVRVGAATDSTTPFGLQVTNADGQASNIYTGLTAQAAGSPPPIQPRGPEPTPIVFGQTINGYLDSTHALSSQRADSYADQYSFSGTAGTEVAISMSGSFDAFLYLIKDGTVLTSDDDGANDGHNGSRIPPNSGTFRLPSSGSYIIEATSYRTAAGSYSLTLSGTPPTTPPPTTPPASTTPSWIYRNDPNLPGLVAVLQRAQVGSSSVYRYGIVIAKDTASFNGGVGPLEALLTIATKYDSSIKVLKSSLKGQLLEESWPFRDTSEFLRQVDTAGWRDGAANPFSDKEIAVARDLLGFIKFGGIGLVVSIASTVADVAALFPDQVDAIGPSNTFAREVASDDYLTHKVEIRSGLSDMFAYRFSFSVEETGTEQPHFFIRLKTATMSPSRLVGIEVLNNRAVPIIRSVEKY